MFNPGDMVDAMLTGKYTEAVTRSVAGGTQNAFSADMTEGVYKITADVDCYFLQGGSTINIAVSNAWPLRAYDVYYVPCEGATDDVNVAWITDGQSGYFYAQKVSR